MNIYEEVLHRLSSKTRIRSLFKDVHAEDLERMLSRMNDVLEEKKTARSKEESKRLEIQGNIEEIKQIMQDKGVSLSDLGLGEKKKVTRRRRSSQKYTFQYKNEGGESITWHGATTGRLPRDFQTYLDRTGKKRLDCVVEELN
ncbi:hypothetical protein CI610_02985 [invertebrate metagenome]|uniref:DNA-binding protein H-NS-like N-terminal domain-containing protein n=1 Tax=invertebrate metagenome TaxID=1711999 RepID=A0A2H9T4D9_9ZZZZ